MIIKDNNLSKATENKLKFHDWFAWFPVYLRDTKRWVIFELVQRKYSIAMFTETSLCDPSYRSITNDE